MPKPRTFSFFDGETDETYEVVIAPQLLNPSRPDLIRIDETCGGLSEGSITLTREGARRLIDELAAYLGEGR